MPSGYLVGLGADFALNAGDSISGALVSFTNQSNLGSGNWIWSGTWNGITFTNELEPGVYYLATDGNVYFVPDFGPVDTLTSASASAPPAYSSIDGTILGTLGDDVIDNSYVDPQGDQVDSGNGAGADGLDDIIYARSGDDTIDAGAGNDTIFAGSDNDSVDGGSGADLIEGGGGSDTIDGGTGNDTIYGDLDAAPVATNEVLDWEALAADETDISAGVVQNTGEMDVSVSFTDAGNNTPTFEVEATDIIYTDVGDPFDTTSSLYLDGNGDADTSVTTINFNASTTSDMSDDVSNVSFRISDIDHGAGNHRDIVTVDAFDADGNAVSVTITPGTGDTVTGNTITAGDGGHTQADAAGSALIEIAGPVHEIQISHSNALTGTQAIWVSDLHFTTIPQSSAAGDDSLDGGAGTDSIFGGDGNDTLTGGTGSDTLAGEAGNDTFYVAQGDVATGGDGDDMFILTDLGEAGTAGITITGAETGESAGDTLDLGGVADRLTLNITDSNDAAGGLSGTVSLTDGSVVTFSNIENIICFTPGTRILTPAGARDILSLRPGDLVVTRDDGPQPVRWIGKRTVAGKGKLAPIRIAPNVLPGLSQPLLVSPQHRVLFEGYRSELLFGKTEVLASAKHLVDGVAVEKIPCDAVTYVHLAFDRHQIIYANGAATESFHVADQGVSAIADNVRDELFAIFPELRGNLTAYGPTARSCLKAREAALLAR